MSLPPPRRAAALAALLLLPLPACVHVPPRPLDPDTLLEEVRRERRDLPTGSTLTLAEAVERMRRVDPGIREARAAWRAAEAVAGVPTPPPNPTLSIGPLLLGGSDVLSAGAFGVDAALGWAVPLGNPRLLRDDLHRVEAGAALARAAAVEREAYLALRRDLAGAVLEEERRATRAGLQDAARAATETGRRLAEVGQATAVDVRLLDLDAERARAEGVAAEGEAAARRERLAARLGLEAARVAVPGAQALPALPTELPPGDALEAAALEHHPRLAALRAAYLVAEKELRLEVAAALPDLELGAAYENEDGAVRLGLPAGIEIPLWDRNQQGIVRACARRDQARVAYAAALQRLLAGVATARARLVAARATREALEAHVAPASQRTLEAARRGLEGGSVDALRYLEVLRAQREVALDVLAARIAEHEAWFDLEEAAGVPLLDFPDSPTAAPAGKDA